MKIFNENYFSSLIGADRERYEGKIKLLNGLDPFEINLENTESDIKGLPDTMFGDVYCYLVNSTSYVTSEEMKNYKSLEAHNYFTSGFLQDLKYVKLNDLVIVLGVVKHSYSFNEKPLKAWVAAKNRGDVITGHCNCMAGIGETCSHVGTILFALEYATVKRNSLSRTSDTCRWLPPSMQNVPCKEISSYSFVSSKKKWKETISKSDVYIQEATEMETPKLKRQRLFTSEERKLDMLKFLAEKGNDCAVMAVTPQLCRKYAPRKIQTPFQNTLLGLYRTGNENLELEELLQKSEEIFPSLCVLDATQRWTIEETTREQNKSKLWFEQKAGRITASKMKSACRTDPNDPSLSLLKSICYPGPNKFVSKYAQHGVDNEPVAKLHYQKKMEKEHLNFSLQQAGLLLHSKLPFIGASPDGIVSCQCHGTGLLEVKCSFYPVVNSCGLINGSLQKHHEYFYQVQTQLLVWGYEYCDFVVWQKNIGLQIERIVKDESFQLVIESQSTVFFKKAVLPELLGKFFTLHKNTPLGERNYDPELTCVCQRPACHPMIRCGNANCDIKVFHWKCVEVKGKRKSWFCFKCIKITKTKK